MYDRELVIEILKQIYQASQTILKRFEPVKTKSYFTDSSAYGVPSTLYRFS